MKILKDLQKQKILKWTRHDLCNFFSPGILSEKAAGSFLIEPWGLRLLPRRTLRPRTFASPLESPHQNPAGSGLYHLPVADFLLPVP